MSLMISWGDSLNANEESGQIYLDAVTTYTQNHNGKVTSHPIADGGLVSDHYIRENNKFNITAVITGADVSTGTYLIQDPDGRTPFNVGLAPTEVSVNSTDQSVLQKFLPDSIGQFLPDSKPTVVVDPTRPDQLEQMRSMLVNLMSGVIFNEKTRQFDPNIQLVTLYEYDGIILRRPVYNLVITSMVFREDQNTGYGLNVTFALEQVTFAFLKKTTIPKSVADAIKKKSSTKGNKGKQDSTPQRVGEGNHAPRTSPIIDPLRKAG